MSLKSLLSLSILPDNLNYKTLQNSERREDGRRKYSRREVQTKQFIQDQMVFRENESGQQAFIVKSGTVEIFKAENEGFVSKEKLLGTLGEGAIFGEMALIDDQPRMASARATDGSLVVYVISKKEFESLLDLRNPFVKKVIEILNEHVRENIEIT